MLEGGAVSHPVKPGTIINGYQGGMFGRESHNEKLCIDSGYSEGEPWAVFKDLGYWGGWVVLHGDEVESINYDEVSRFD